MGDAVEVRRREAASLPSNARTCRLRGARPCGWCRVNRPAFALEATCAKSLRRKAETEAEEMRHVRRPAIRREPRHLFRAAHAARASSAKSFWRTSRAKCPHRHGAHQRRWIAEQPLGFAAQAIGSPELPMAISTLRMKRSRPVRLTGEPENSLRKPASSSRASSASWGATRSSRALSFASRAAAANLFHGQTARQSSQP